MSVSTPRISIITPSYNNGHYLEQTIDSVLSQNYPHLEYIIIDGGSDDNSVEIIRKYEKHLAYWVSEKDNGQSDAINKGLQKVTGEVFNWLNSDDYYLPNALKTIGEHFLDPNLNVLCAKSRIVQNEKTIKISSGTDIYKDNLAKTIGWARIDQPETFFRKSILDEIGVLNPELHYVMDKELWMRYLLRFGLEGIKKTDDELVAFRLHEASKTSTKQEEFELETRSLFYALAKELGLNDLANEVAQMGVIENTSAINHFANIDAKLGYSSVHYFLLYKYLRYYAENNFREAKALANSIDATVLTKEDLGDYQKISHRMRYPVALKKLLNWLSS